MLGTRMGSVRTEGAGLLALLVPRRRRTGYLGQILGAFGLNRHWGRKVLQSQLRGNTGVSRGSEASMPASRSMSSRSSGMGSVEAAASPTVAAERRKPPLGKRIRRCPGSNCGGRPPARAASGGPYVLGQEGWPLGPVWAGLCPLHLLSPAVQGCAWPFTPGALRSHYKSTGLRAWWANL